MRIAPLIPLLLLASACSTPPLPATVPVPAATTAGPPIAARKPFAVESPNGTRSDEYYWLRDDTRQSKEVLDYLNAENAWRDTAMAHTVGLQQELYAELVARVDPDESSVPVYDRGYWYYTRFEPGRDYPVYARRKGTLTAPEQVMLDGNELAGGQKFFLIETTGVSPDGKLLAWTEDTVGRRQYTLKVKNLDSGITLPDVVANVEPGIVWAADSRTLLYVAKDPVTLLSERVQRHTLGTDPATDALIYAEQDPSFYLSVSKSRSEKYLFIALASTDESEWHYAEASDPGLRFRPVRQREHQLIYDVEHLDTDFVLRTNWQAPNFRIVKTPILSSADKSSWRDVLPHRAAALVESFAVSTTHLAVNERSLEIVKLLIENGARPDDRSKKDETSPLTLAAANGDLEIVTYLLDHKADVDLPGALRETALIKATRAHHNDVIKLLIERGANADDTDSSGTTALEIAQRAGWKDTEALFKTKKATTK